MVSCEVILNNLAAILCSPVTVWQSHLTLHKILNLKSLDICRFDINYIIRRKYPFPHKTWIHPITYYGIFIFLPFTSNVKFEYKSMYFIHQIKGLKFQIEQQKWSPSKMLLSEKILSSPWTENGLTIQSFDKYMWMRMHVG